MKTCVYLVNDNHFYKRMVANSIEMLRRYSNIPIKLFFIEDEGKQSLQRSNMIQTEVPQFLKFCNKHQVEVIKRPPLGQLFHENRSYLQECQEDEILFMDGDTFVFGNIEELFEKYKEYDFVARESRWMEQEGWDSEKLVGKKIRPFNSGVMYWKKNWLQEWSKNLPKTLAGLLNGEYNACQFLEPNRYGNREEVSVTLFVAENDLKYGYFTEDECYVIENYDCLRKLGKSLIFHSYSDQWAQTYRTLNKKSKKLLINPKIIKFK